VTFWACNPVFRVLLAFRGLWPGRTITERLFARAQARAGHVLSLLLQAFAAALTLSRTLGWDPATHRAWVYGMVTCLAWDMLVVEPLRATLLGRAYCFDLLENHRSFN